MFYTVLDGLSTKKMINREINDVHSTDVEQDCLCHMFVVAQAHAHMKERVYRHTLTVISL